MFKTNRDIMTDERVASTFNLEESESISLNFHAILAIPASHKGICCFCTLRIYAEALHKEY
jgi:hypothetical protein